MLTVNVDINDRLINGQMGTIARIVINQNTNKPSVIFIKVSVNENCSKLLDFVFFFIFGMSGF